MPFPARRWSRLGACLAALITIGVTTVVVSIPAAADPLQACTPKSGAVVAVDFRPWGGQVLRGCDATPTTEFDLLSEAGFTTTGTVHDGPGFICRIGNAGFDGGTQYPKPAQEPCDLTPPASAYWSYWFAASGQDVWTYSPLRAAAKVPGPGEVQAWVYGDADANGTTGKPTFTPAEVRATGNNPPPTTSGPAGSNAQLTPAHPLDSEPHTNPVPNLAKAVAWLVAPEQLIDGRYYGAHPGFPDFGLTIDGAFALAATGYNDTKLRAITEFIRGGGKVGDSEYTVNTWLGIGTDHPSGGAIGKVALLAQVTGHDPRTFGGHDLIATLHDITCTGADAATGCVGAGNYRYARSVFSQVLGIMAQLRAGQRQDVAAPVAFLKSLQGTNGAFPGVIPSNRSGDKVGSTAIAGDVDSTAMAAMALAMLPDDPAAVTAVDEAIAWLAAQQHADGGFPGAAGNSTNSAALAVQGLTLRSDAHTAQIGKALEFLAGQQNPDGGFNVAPGTQPGSNVRASTQVIGGATGISFATLLRDVHDGTNPTPSGSAPPSASTSPTATAGGPHEPGGSGSVGGMPVTGQPIATMVLVAAVLIGAGAVLLILARRRRADATAADVATTVDVS